MPIEKELQNIHLNMHRGKKKVFSGVINEVPAFLASNQKADRAELYNADGSAVVSMRFQDLKSLLED